MLLPPPVLWPFFSAAQEGVAAAKAIAPTTPSMSGSFITALFMVAPPVLCPKTGHGRINKTWPLEVGSLYERICWQHALFLNKRSVSCGPAAARRPQNRRSIVAADLPG